MISITAAHPGQGEGTNATSMIKHFPDASIRTASAVEARLPVKAPGKCFRTAIFATGHRNPQGLFLHDLGRMWLVEQGLRGGD